MSKVKYEFDTPHSKAKARRSLRRKESFKVRNKRMKEADLYYGGYFVKDTRMEYKITGKVFVPEREYNTGYSKVIDVDENGHLITKYVEGEIRIIPAHYRKTRKFVGEKEIEPYLKRISFHSKKYYKKRANKKIRHRIDTFSDGDYKKAFDVAWNVY